MKPSNSLILSVVVFLIGTAVNACRPTPRINSYPVSGMASAEGEFLGDSTESELARVKAESESNKSESSKIKKQIEHKQGQLAKQANMSEDEKKTVESEIAGLSKQQADLDAQNKALNTKQAALEKQMEEGKNSAVANANGASGFPLCGNIYFGTVFNCNGKSCAKSDPQYKNICEIAANSKPANANGAAAQTASGFPLCGATFYGTIFNCNGKACAKSDPAYQNICELTAASSAAGANQAQARGASGYPFCGNFYYGSVFICSGRSCAKSDPNYQNICELGGGAAVGANQAASIGSSGYPLCPGFYYGTQFACNNGRVCAKSDPAYQNICELY